MSYTPPPPPPPSGPGGYQGGPPAQPKTSVMSIISLVLGIVSVPGCGYFVFSIAAIVLGILGRKEVQSSNGAVKGGGMATAGLILGAVTLLIGVLITMLQLLGVIENSYNLDTTM